jgi:hypothetical protein
MSVVVADMVLLTRRIAEEVLGAGAGVNCCCDLRGKGFD